MTIHTHTAPALTHARNQSIFHVIVLFSRLFNIVVIVAARLPLQQHTHTHRHTLHSLFAEDMESRAISYTVEHAQRESKDERSGINRNEKNIIGSSRIDVETKIEL